MNKTSQNNASKFLLAILGGCGLSMLVLWISMYGYGDSSITRDVIFKTAEFWIGSGILLGIALWFKKSNRVFLRWLYRRVFSQTFRYCKYCPDYWKYPNFCIGSFTEEYPCEIPGVRV